MIFWYIMAVLTLGVLVRIAFTLVSIDLSLAAIASHVSPEDLRKWLAGRNSRKEDGA